MGLVSGCFHKSLLLLYMYTKSFALLDVNLFCTLLWTDGYELQFRLHDDVQHTYAKIQQAIGASVHPLAPIKSQHSCVNKYRSFTKGMLEKGP